LPCSLSTPPCGHSRSIDCAPSKMAGATSLQDDILALVKKHSETCLPQDLLSRLSEESRLLAAREEIRSLHEADPFGIFSDSSDDEEEDGDKKEAEEDGSGSESSSKTGRDSAGGGLPDSVLRMLDMMRISRLDKVTALDGFTTIDAEVEFVRAKHSTAVPVQGKPKLSEVKAAAATADALAEAGQASEASGSTGGVASTAHEERGDDDASSSASSSDDSEVEEEEEEDPEAPVFLTFRFRREPLVRGKSNPAEDAGAAEEQPGIPPRGGGGSSREAIDLAMDDDEEDGHGFEDGPGNEGGRDEATPKVASALKSDAGSAGEGVGDTNNAAGQKKATLGVVAKGKDSGSNGVGASRESRKRAVSRGSGNDGDDGGSGKGRKRPKGVVAAADKHDHDHSHGHDHGHDHSNGRDHDEKGSAEKGNGERGDAERGTGEEGGPGCEEGECETGWCCEDGDLPYPPRTLITYSISGGIGYRPPVVLLQAVVYARGDRPACVMPPPEAREPEGEDDAGAGGPKGGGGTAVGGGKKNGGDDTGGDKGDDGADPDGDEEGSTAGKDGNDNGEDVFDCNLNGPALSAVGRALGLHTEEDESDSDSDSESEKNEGAADRKMRVKKLPGKKEKAPATDAE
ncbi:unnamed protein product, partial [Scytosiphon promiscuus]